MVATVLRARTAIACQATFDAKLLTGFALAHVARALASPAVVGDTAFAIRTAAAIELLAAVVALHAASEAELAASFGRAASSSTTVIGGHGAAHLPRWASAAVKQFTATVTDDATTGVEVLTSSLDTSDFWLATAVRLDCPTDFIDWAGAAINHASALRVSYPTTIGVEL